MSPFGGIPVSEVHELLTEIHDILYLLILLLLYGVLLRGIPVSEVHELLRFMTFSTIPCLSGLVIQLVF